MTPPPIIEGCEPDPRTCRNCGELRKQNRLCSNCGYHTGAFLAAVTTLPKERRSNTVLRRIYDAMFKSGAMKRSE
jgi:hypothetical protein